MRGEGAREFRRYVRPSASGATCYPSGAVGLILDLAVVVLALLVLSSLAILAWTLAVSSVRAAEAGRERVAEARRSMTLAEDRLRAVATRTRSTLAELSNQTSPGDRSDR
jgi:hypothetical protein